MVPVAQNQRSPPEGKGKAKGRSIKLHTAKVRIYSCLAKRSATFLLYLQQFSFFFEKNKANRNYFRIFAEKIKS